MSRILLVSCAALGFLILLACGGTPAPVGRPVAPAGPDETRPTETQPTKPAPAPVVRDFDAAALAELRKAFRENPVRAKSTYETVRWRFFGRVQEFKVFSVAVNTAVGTVGVVLPEGEVSKLTLNKDATIEATLLPTPNPVEPVGVTVARFGDGKVIR